MQGMQDENVFNWLVYFFWKCLRAQRFENARFLTKQCFWAETNLKDAGGQFKILFCLKNCYEQDRKWYSLTHRFLCKYLSSQIFKNIVVLANNSFEQTQF